MKRQKKQLPSKKIVLPLSGGMDSTVLFFMACNDPCIKEVHTLTFDYGQRHSIEIKMVNKQVEAATKRFTNKLITNKVIDTKFIRELSPTSSLTNDDIETPNVVDMRGEAQPASYVPNRNTIFLSICTGYAEALKCDEVWHGATKVDSLAGYWDASPEYLPCINNVNSLNRHHRVSIVAPLIELSKGDIVKKGVELGVNFKDTYTCYTGCNTPSIYSPSSSLRIRGFIEAGYIDPLEYQEDLKDTWKTYKCKVI